MYTSYNWFEKILILIVQKPDSDLWRFRLMWFGFTRIHFTVVKLLVYHAGLFFVLALIYFSWLLILNLLIFDCLKETIWIQPPFRQRMLVAYVNLCCVLLIEVLVKVRKSKFPISVGVQYLLIKNGILVYCCWAAVAEAMYSLQITNFLPS